MRAHGFWTALVSLSALASVTFLGKAYETSLRGIDSNIHGAVSMSVTSGPGLAPRLPIPIRNFQAAAPSVPGSKLDPNLYFNDHPFFLFWVNGLILRAFGPSAWSARLLTALFSVGTVLLTFLIGSLLVSRPFGMVAALLTVFCRDFVLTSATMSLDTALVFFIVLTFYLWLRGRWFWLGIAAGVGLWIKTPLVLLVFPTAVIYAAIQKKLKQDWRGLACAGGLAVLVGSIIWIYTGVHGGWELVQDYWLRQFWGTAVQGRGQAQGTDFGFFWYYVRTGFLPGFPFLLVALALIAKNRKWREASFLVPAIAVLILAFVVTVMRFKLGHYVTPVFPFLALISAHSVGRWVEQHETRFYSGLSIVAILLMAFLLVTPVGLGPEAFVALKRFVPLIQTHGNCDDHIALIPGGEPVGGDLDYRLFLNFYTGRYVDVVECSQVGQLTRALPQWVIVSHENFERCLSQALRKKYLSTYRMGSQYLLTTLTASAPVIDLTPLELELKAVTDCKAPPFPKDIWHRYD
ncbi:glycosyltransferase family 39 protein [Bdellovibrionota bacterium FG-1]